MGLGGTLALQFALGLVVGTLAAAVWRCSKADGLALPASMAATVNGKAEIVVQDAQSYQRMIDRLHHMETVAAIQEGMASAERGELKPAAQVLAEMRARYGLSR
jgi:predicted transcriptional regulator